MPNSGFRRQWRLKPTGTLLNEGKPVDKTNDASGQVRGLCRRDPSSVSHPRPPISLEHGQSHQTGSLQQPGSRCWYGGSSFVGVSTWSPTSILEADNSHTATRAGRPPSATTLRATLSFAALRQGLRRLAALLEGEPGYVSTRTLF